MKNIITFDVIACSSQVRTEEGGNSVVIEVLSASAGSKLEIYYGSTYYTSVDLENVSSQQIVISNNWCRDAELVHVRYVGSNTTSKFIHIIGDESAYDDLVLIRSSDYLYSCGGSGAPKDVDYLQELATLIGVSSSSDVEGCYNDLFALEEIFNNELVRLKGNAGTTVKQSVQNLKAIKGQTPNGYIAPIKSFIGVKFVDKTIDSELWRMDQSGKVMYRSVCTVGDNTITIQAHKGDLILATAYSHGVVGFPEGFTELCSLAMNPNPEIYEWRTVSCAYIMAENEGENSFTLSVTGNVNLIAIHGAKSLVYDSSYQASRNSVSASNPLTPKSKTVDDILIWVCGAYDWATSKPYGDWVCSNDGLDRICLDQQIAAPIITNFIDALEDSGERSFYPDPKTTAGRPATIGAIKIQY